ncbi:hypothetical protein GCM10011371_33300 [Novosphingobium marinum]|uniref:Spore coat protein U domain-containing protein n=2 Tax=Novosphingobium marinum TaxID=1514948 RepID=A0A7Z0BV94_9SPHN|nr:hypothetical protein [Novosphingobium marinum]NYH97054.1 hypothetical protein [Novosphingobium marinum]GGC43181.1 hypothetical protein GCM10011371_33300 [Novosphingobium marinum]
MLRQSLFALALLIGGPATAQPFGSGAIPVSSECLVRVTAMPATWLIEGYDPFGTDIPEGTFSVAFTNEGTSECRFKPVFELDQPPFGLSSGSGRQIGYALLSMQDAQDVTPRAGRTQRVLSQSTITLAPAESRTVLYKLVVDPTDVRTSGTYSEDLTIVATDASMKTFGGARLVVGLNVLPSARIGLAGAYTIENGRALVDLGELRAGKAPTPLQLRVKSTGRFELVVTSQNSGKLRLGGTNWFVPYTMAIGDRTLNLLSVERVSGSERGSVSGMIQESALPIEFTIGDVSNRRAGTYSDTILISVSAK